MNTGGISETIWHFAGYLRIPETTLTGDVLYDGDHARLRPDDDPAVFLDPVRQPQFDDLASQRQPFLELVFPEPALHTAKLGTPSPVRPSGVAAPAMRSFQPHQTDDAFDSSDHASLIYGKRLISVQYQDGGTETLLSAHQVNQIDDRDTLTSDAIRYANGDLVVPPEAHTGQAFAHMVEEAYAATPASMPLEAVGNTQSLTQAIDARDQAWSQDGHLPGEESSSQAPTGRIVDGHVSDAPLPEPPMTQIAPWRDAATPDVHEITASVTALGPTQGVGTIAETGLNTQINQAAILDVNEATGSLMIGGNYYSSRGIVQVNVLTDNDHVDIATDNQALPSVFTHGNEVHNVAEFVNHDITASYRGAAGTPLWNVDVLQGNFYDVKTVVQFNGLDDSDRTVQATAGTYYEAQTGGNLQVNLAQITNLDSYDIIIVGGDYHRADWIYQYNIVLDSDVAKLFLSHDASGGVTDVNTGFNQLTNSADITTYDSAGFTGMNGAQHDLLNDLSSHATVLTPNPDWKLAGNSSGTLKVLYVSGDYYDVNVVSQVNMMIDVDQSIQASATTGSRQGIASGGNYAVNDAQIIDPGTLSTSKYLGGQAYEDSILIQTNLITDHDTVTIHDTSTLVPELVAFAHDAEVAAATDNPLYRPADTAHHDILI